MLERKNTRHIKWLLLIFACAAFLIFSSIFFISFGHSQNKVLAEYEYDESDTCLYHIIVTGTYENQSFLTKVFEGAKKKAAEYNAVVELHVPELQADTTTIQELFDYCSFLNADGIIAYIDSADEVPILLQRTDSPQIPLITTGHLSVNLPQISFIGTNNWELGKKFADETKEVLKEGGNAYIITDTLSINSSNLISSLQRGLQENSKITQFVIKEISQDFKFRNKKNVFITLTEEDTISTAFSLSELFPDKDYSLIGFGSNEVCQLYLQKGLITELFSQNPEQIGEVAIRELFEYRNRGYANSYVTADVKISRRNDEN